MYDDISFDDVNVFPDMEDPADVSESDTTVSDWWLDPVDVSGSDVSGTDSSDQGIQYLEIDLDPIQNELQKTNSYLNLFFGIFCIAGIYFFVRRIVFKINTKGRGIDE